MVFEPTCNWTAAADQSAEVLLPSSVAVPDPPRLLAHFTRYRRMLSAARPVKPTTPVLPAAVDAPIVTVGAT